MIRRGQITLGGNDDLVSPFQQIQYLGKTCDSEVFFPYGFHANLPPESDVITFNLFGQSSNKISFAGMPSKRIPVKTGEVIVFHPLTGSNMYFKNNGDIVATVGETELTISKGGVSIKGSLAVSGAITADTVTTDTGIDLDTHTHLAGSLTNGGGTVTGTTGAPS